jgi:hypothetical protein
MSTQKSPARPLVVFHNTNHDRNAPRVFGAVLFSFLVNGTLVIALMLGGAFFASALPEGNVPEDDKIIVDNLPSEEPPPNLEKEPVGFNPAEDKAIPVDNIAPDTMIGSTVDPLLPVGNAGDPEKTINRLPPPPGVDGGPGVGRIDDNKFPFRLPPGREGGGLRQRLDSATIAELLRHEGGNFESQAAVARGQHWLADHQAPDGHWSFEHLCRFGKCNCTGSAKYDDVAATALGLLPFLGAGQTHKGGSALGNKYTKNVDAAIKYLLRRQNIMTGEFHPLMYSHGLATMAICEAYGLTSDPTMKRPAQKALDYIVDAQSAEGGWRYARQQPGYDTSVCGWQLMALKSGQMAGLSVPTRTLKRCELWLDAAGTPDGGAYGYTSRGEGTNTTAVGLLCREYLGWGPRNLGLQAGIRRLETWQPQPDKMYFSYYATQVMHHAGGNAWQKWNQPMRDGLIKAQDQGQDPRHRHQEGSWYHEGCYGGRLMETSLSILTLEVYYRHLPLYNREAIGDKELLRGER